MVKVSCDVSGSEFRGGAAQLCLFGEFAARRVHTAARRLRMLEGTIVRWKLVRAAGLHYHLERQPKVKAALDYEVRPSVAVTILQDGVRQFPQEMIRPPARIPSRIRPLAIVQPIA